MKKLFVVLWISLPLLGWAQAIPEFQFTLYAEDTLGHRDSIVLGFDPSAQGWGLNPQFGEVDITQVPFDSVFELRAHTDFSHSSTHSKVRITEFHCDNPYPFPYTSFIGISIRSRHSPIRFYWDQSLFQDTCKDWIVMSDATAWQFDSYLDTFAHSILSQTGEFVIERPGQGSSISSYNAFHNGGGFAPVYPVYLYFWSDSLLNRTSSTRQRYPDLTAKVFPNPAREYVQVELPDAFEQARTFQLYNAAGQVVLTQAITDYNFEVAVSQLPPGWYAYTAINAKGYTLRGKLILTE